MSKVLQRAMFKKPQHEHRSTGIASGLKYREGYAVGGRVRLSHGGPPPHPEDQSGLAGINPDLGMGNITFQNVQEILDKPSMIRDPLTMDDAIAAQKKLREGLTEIPYGTAATPFETITGAAADTLSKQFKEGEGGQLADFIVNVQRRGEEAKTTRQELDTMAARDKRADELAIITGAREDVEKDKDRLADEKKMEIDTNLTVANLANQFNISGLNRQTSLDTARIAANALPAELRTYDRLFKQFKDEGVGDDEARSRAYSMAFQTLNSQLDLAATLIGALSGGEYETPEQKSAAVLKAFEALNIISGGNPLLTQEALENLGDVLGTQPSATGAGTGAGTGSGTDAINEIPGLGGSS